MITFEDITKDKCFITDMKENKSFYDMGTGHVESLSRYAVWSPLKDAEGHTINEIGDNLKHLQEKYAITDDLILTVNLPEHTDTTQ